MFRRSVIVAILGGLLSFHQLVGLAMQSADAGIAGVVRDPQNAVIAGALVTATSESGQVRSTTTNEQGRYKIDNLAPGRYTVVVESKGFKRGERTATVESGRAAVLDFKLEVAAPAEELTVPGRGGVAPNTDPAYRHLRDHQHFETYAVSNLVLKRDVGTLTLTKGLVSFESPTMGRVVKAVFTGEGTFTLSPALPIEGHYLASIIEKQSVEENFEKAVFCFTDRTYEEIKQQSQSTGTDPRAGDILKDLSNKLRLRQERPRSLVEALVSSDGDNLEVELLAHIYNPKRPGAFKAFITGKKYNDLRFVVRPNGAMPQILSPEEVALINVDPAAEREGIWYLAHFESEYRSMKASSEEDKRVIDVQHYKIETVIGTDSKLTASAEIIFKAMDDGDRVIGFGLLPSLRVSRVRMGEKDISFIQEPRKEDGAFCVILPEGTAKGKQYSVTIEYRGDRVVQDAGGGNFSVGARESWYPSANAFNDRATFDLTFKVPKKYTLVGVGKLVKEWTEEGYAASEWVSEVPLAVAGFNYGAYKKKELTDNTTGYVIEGYATTELPSSLRGAEEIGGMSPSRLTDNAMTEAENSIRIFSAYFGKAPYGRIAITQQPQLSFGQSWPTLVYLPIIAFFDSTQRWRLMGGINTRLTDFIQEVTPHEVAHQWWGHMVGWASYHDQWLSEGFADFSAGLYLQLTEKTPDKYITFWKRSRERILEKNQFGRRSNDAGPIWMGLRLNTFRSPFAYQQIVYPKGGYILHMLRSIMWDNKNGDKAFMEMMQDFVSSNLHQNASTESFKHCVEKHMSSRMDLEGNKRMDWFFREWVYGTEVPSYKLVYSITPDSDGKFILTGTLSQSGVSDGFSMLVPIYLDFDGKIVRLGEANVTGTSTTPEFKVKLPQKPKRVLINYYNDVLAVESISQAKN